MTKYCGDEYLVQIRTSTGPDVFTTVACVRNTALTINHELVDVTTKGDDGHREILGCCGVQQMNLTGDGVFNDQAAFLLIHDSALAGDHQMYKLISSKGDSYRGKFEVASFDRGGVFNKEETWGMSLESATTIVHTPVLPPMNLWLDAYDDDTITLASGRVSNIANKGLKGSSWDMGQSIVSAQPIVVPNSGNGLQSIFIDVMELLESASGSVTMENSFDIFVACKPVSWLTDSDDNAVFWHGSDAGTVVFEMESGNRTRDGDGLFGMALESDIGWPSDPVRHVEDVTREWSRNWHIFQGSFNPTTEIARLYVDGEYIDKTILYDGDMNAEGTKKFFAGGNSDFPPSMNGFSMFMGEIIMTNGVMTTAQRIKIENYLGPKWGVCLNQVEDPAL